MEAHPPAGARGVLLDLDLELVLVRHGETSGRSSIRLYGATDVALSKLGIAQMRAVGRALAGERFDRVVVSPLSRSRDAVPLVLPVDAPPLEVVEAFREIDFGDWEGWTLEEAAARDPAGYAAWEADGAGFRFPGGESRVGFAERVRTGLSRLTDGEGRRVLGVLHTGVIRVILRELLGLDFEASRRLPVELGSIHRLRRSGGSWTLVQGNGVAHLAELERIGA